MATLPKVLINRADYQIGGGVALRLRTQDRLKSKVGEITMDNELLYAKIEALEGKRPLAHRRSRR